MTSPWHRVVGVALLTLLTAILVHSAWRVGPTYDEHFYIASGMYYLETGDFTLNREHPPLLKLMAGAPIWLFWKLGLVDVAWPAHPGEMTSFTSALIFKLNGASLGLFFFLARLPFVALTLAMVVALWRKAHHVFGERAGLAAILLVGFNPNTIAQGHLAVLDGGVTAWMLLAVLAYATSLSRPSWRATLVAGVLFGLANLAKSTALVLAPTMGVLALAVALWTRSLRPLRDTALAWFVGLGVFALGYGFEARSINDALGSPRLVSNVALAPLEEDEAAAASELLAEVRAALAAPAQDGSHAAAYARLGELEGTPADLRREATALLLDEPGDDLADQRLALLPDLAWRSFPDLDGWRAWFDDGRGWSGQAHVLGQPLLRGLVVGLFGYTRPVPLLTALVGLDYQLTHAGKGHMSAYKGEILLSPLSFSEGNPHPEYYSHILAIKNPLPMLVLLVAGLVLGLARRVPWHPVELVVLLAVPAVLFYTFSRSNMLMGMRYVLPVLPFLGLFAASVGAVLPRATLGLAALAALPALTTHPHQLMYYSWVAGGNDLREGGPAISVISDDWGQAVREVGRFYQEHRDELDALGGFHYAPMTPGSPLTYGLAGVQPPHEGVEGIVAVHALDYWRDHTGVGFPPERSYTWLDELEPFGAIDDSVYLFDTRPDATGEAPLALD